MRRWSGVARTHFLHPSHLAGTRSHIPRRSLSALAQHPAPQKGPAVAHNDNVVLEVPKRPDPYKLLEPQLAHLRTTLLDLLGSSHPSLSEIAKYYFLHPSKQLRPLIVLLFAQATNGLGREWARKEWAAEVEGAGGKTEELNQPLTRPDVLNDWNPSMPDHTASFDTVFTLRNPRPLSDPIVPPPRSFNARDMQPTLSSPSPLLPTQMRLAQIVEMIHVASLLHDDVIDKSPLRRGAASAPAAFGNKLTVLAGDFLLGRASAALSRLGESEVVELIASVIANLVEGEILQMKQVHAPELGLVGMPRVGKEAWNVYLKKTYLKTASLMAKGARASVVLGGCREGEIWKEVAYAYGRNIGIAFQVRDLAKNETNISKTNRQCSLSMTYWIMRLAKQPSVNLEVQIFS